MSPPRHVQRELADKREEAAYHEAGHVVGFLAGGFTVERVELFYRQVGWRRRWRVYGNTYVDDALVVQASDPWRAGIAAGPVAAALWLSSQEGSGGYREALRFVLRHAAQEDRRMLRLLTAGSWGSYRTAFRTARIIVERYWGNVTTIADALDTAGTVSGPRIKRLLRIPEVV